MSSPDYNPKKTKSTRSFKSRVLKAFKKLVLTIGFAYLMIVVALVLMENQMIYPAPRYPAGNWEPSFEHKDIEFTSADGTGIHAWVMRCDNEDSSPRYVLHCHGNGENVAYSAGWAGCEIVDKLDANVMLFDYRGYGKSEGTPNEEGIKLDAERAMDVMCDEFDIQPSDVILIGQSLGGAVAAHLASTRGCKALVLQRTFSSLPDVAASKYPWIPVRILMQNNFDSCTALANYCGPLFQSHGQADTIVPIRFGKRVYEQCSNPVNRFVELPRVGHNDGFPSGYWDQVDDWLDEVETAQANEPVSSDQP